MNLPPLPDGRVMGSGTMNGKRVELRMHDDNVMRAYGVACAVAALEEAANIASAMANRNYPWGSENSDVYHAQAHWAALIATKIRALIGETK